MNPSTDPKLRRSSPVPRSSRMWKRRLAGLGCALYVAAIVATEARHPLRHGKRELKLTRDVRNLLIAGLAATTIHLLENPIVRPLSRYVGRRRWGLLQFGRLSAPLEIAVGILLMDYTLYLWHILTHKVPFLWRFHAAHHVDLDMDASTAIRFHFGELALSVPYRAVQVLLLGIAPDTLSVWQAFTLVSILFHHSNIRLSPAFERNLQRLVVTPRLHGIHHSTVPNHTDSNWSSGLTVWDFLHRTFRCDIPQNVLVMGVAGIDQPQQVTLHRTLLMPFQPPAAIIQFLAATEGAEGTETATVAPRR